MDEPLIVYCEWCDKMLHPYKPRVKILDKWFCNYWGCYTNHMDEYYSGVDEDE